LFERSGLESLVQRRGDFYRRVVDVFGSERLVERCSSDPLITFHYFLDHDDMGPILAKFVYDILAMFPL
jgi:hypothetical protein